MNTDRDHYAEGNIIITVGFSPTAQCLGYMYISIQAVSNLSGREYLC